MSAITNFNRHCNAIKKAFDAGVQEKKNIKKKNEAIMLGTKIYENPSSEEIMSELFDREYNVPAPTHWHGTHYPLVAEQIENGQFEKHKKDIYNTNNIGVAQFFGTATASKEAHRTGKKGDPVILRTASDAGIGKNSYNEYYYSKDSDKPVYILEAYRKEDDEEPPSFMESARAICNVTRDTYYQEIGNTE